MSINISKCDGCGEMKPVERIYFKDNSFLEFCSDCLWSMTQKKYRLRELEVENARLRTVAKAAKALLDRIEVVAQDERYKAVWFTAQLHLGPYDGPQYKDQVDALRKALEEADRDARG